MLSGGLFTCEGQTILKLYLHKQAVQAWQYTVVLTAHFLIPFKVNLKYGH